MIDGEHRMNELDSAHAARDASVAAGLLSTAHSLKIDRATAEVVTELRHAGIQSVLLKGPAIVKLLYPRGQGRPYVDCDLLLRSQDFERAGAVLQRIGFRRPITPEDELVAEWQRHSHGWVRAIDSVALELHWTLTHVGAAPERAWDVLTRASTHTSVCGVNIQSPGPPQLATIIALHVAAHASVNPQPLQDLARALDHFDRATWRDAASVARELEALDAFAAGLRRLDKGRSAADELGLSAQQSMRVALTSVEMPTRARLGTTLLEDFMATPGLEAKLRRAAWVAVPSPAYMRHSAKPLARRGRAGLIAAYAWRPMDLAAKAAPVILAWMRARRRAKR